MKRLRVLCIRKSPTTDIFILESIGQAIPDGRYDITKGLPDELNPYLRIVKRPYGFGWGIEKLNYNLGDI